jgi:E-phenylitaconyl-CoA hydratase
MPSETLRFDIADGVALITLNRPEALNALNRELSGALMEALHTIRDADAIRVGVLTGEGRAFSAGADLKERAAGGASGPGGDSPATFLAANPAAGYATFDTGKPLIAAIGGHCLAGGLELALTCDIRIASDDARFGVPEITRGFFPGAGAPQRLPRMIPHALAMEMLLTGDPIDAAGALRAGLVSRVVPREQLLPTAMAVARRIAAHAPLAVRAVRELAYAADDMTLAQAMRYGGSLRWIIGQTEDAAEGPRAFAEKREPRYQGR